MRERLLVSTLVLLLALSGCGSVNTGYYGESDGLSYTQTNGFSGGSSKADVAYNSWLSNSFGSSNGQQNVDVVYSPEADSATEHEPNQTQGGAEINKDMLVYHGSVTVSTKEYDKAMDSLKVLFETYDCFIESSSERSNYRYSDDSQLMIYSATIRVNSKDYASFMDGASSVGVVASKSSIVENMNLEYSDTVTALRIYQARLDRYLARLETETDNEIAIQLEREITSIQVTLQQLEARKSLIETDVAYSYVDLTIQEVEAFTSQVTHDDPLHKRVWAEIVNTYYEFTEFLTEVLFFIIHAFPYLVILGAVIFVLRKKLKFKRPSFKFRKRKKVDDTFDHQDSTQAK